MRYTISSEQIKFFKHNSYLALEDLLGSEEAKKLLCLIDAVNQKSPGYTQDNLFRSIPLIMTLAKRKGWAEMASQLLQKKHVRLLTDRFFDHFPTFTHALDNESLGLLIELESHKGLFFRQIPENQNHLPKSDGSYLFLLFTIRYLPEPQHPILNQ